MPINRVAPARFAAMLATLTGAVALSGWLLHVHVLKSVLPRAVEMKTNTAIAIVLGGLALHGLASPASPAVRKLAQAIGVVVGVIGALTLAEYLGAGPWSIDEWFVSGADPTDPEMTGRMSPLSAAALLSLGAGLFWQPYARLRPVVRAGALMGLAIGLLSLVGYAWNAAELVTDRWLPPVALNTALCLALLGGGLLAAPRGGRARYRRPFPTLASVESRSLTGFTLAMALLVAGGGYTYRSQLEFAAASAWIEHTEQLRTALARLEAAVADARLAQGDYLLTSNPVRREDYLVEFGAAQRRLTEIERLVGDNDTQRRNVLALSNLIGALEQAMSADIAALQNFGPAAARALVSQGDVQRAMQAVRAATQRMRATESALLEARRAAHERAHRSTLLALLTTLVLAAAIFVALFRGIRREMRARRATANALRELNAELGAQTAQLRAINQELESFSYTVSHDLRAPLRAIDGFAVMLEEDHGPLLDPEARRYLGVIRRNARRMGELIDDLLALSRLGRQPLISRPVDMQALVRAAVEEVLAGCAQPPSIAIGMLPEAAGAPGLLRQVWTNLLANAVKYSSKRAAPRIEVSGERIDGENRYLVRDNGVGFDMAYADKLFGVFQRLHRADEFGGTGVGLAIVQRIVVRHGGRVWAQGQIDEGAAFGFSLPQAG